LADAIKNEQPLTSLAGMNRAETDLWVDGTAKDLAALSEFAALTTLRIYRLPRRQVPVFAGLRLPKLATLRLRHVDADDLTFLERFAATLQTLNVWQSPKIKRLDGVERLTKLGALTIGELGAIESLAPLAAMPGLRVLALTGGVEQAQQLPSLAPLRALTGLEQLSIEASKVADGDLGPLAALAGVTELALSPRFFDPEEIAAVAAAHPAWHRKLTTLGDFDKWAGTKGCKKCGTGRKVLFLRRKKLLWCPQCEGAKLAANLAAFEQLVEEKKRALRR